MYPSTRNIFWKNPVSLPAAKKQKLDKKSSPAPTQKPRTVATILNQNPSDNLRKPISELSPKFRPIFPYVSFNHVQSLVFDAIFNTSKPIVVSAPTGSGKTGVFELAIVKCLMEQDKRPIDFGAAKIIYLAPTKALCGERRDDWEKKFGPYNIQCIELTSDSSNPINFKNLNKMSILLATPEKWDSITRSWNGQKAFVQSIRLLLVDEVHLVNDGVRGATLEAVISRMKTIRSIIWPNEQDNLRFVAVSATVSNVQDIADWFTTPTSEAAIYQVDPNERPVKLRTLVMGYTAKHGINEYRFDSLLNHKLSDIIKEYSNEKPTLIFCVTRKSCSNAANVLLNEGGLELCCSSEKRKLYLQLSNQIKDKALQETTRKGVAFHHAGLCASDRRLVESGFTDGSVMVLCSTSTLAMGVNLPAHLVIIKNTSYYDEGQFKPYSESSLVQMIGRAGRPQYDTEATAVIMTKSFCRDAIEKMLSGKLIVDSQLHKFLTEHLNSEIVLGTITNDTIARKWMDSTFLHVRLLKNPENYGLTKKSSDVEKEYTMMSWCNNSITQLLRYKMIRRDKQNQLEPTEVGCFMARHYICLNTMVKLMTLKGDESLWELILIICSSHEVSGDVSVRTEDKPTLTALINPKDEGHKLRFPVLDKVFSRERKAAVLIQAIFGNVPITEITMYQESMRVHKNAVRVMNCLKDIALICKSIKYRLLYNILILSQCFQSELWENSLYVSKQLDKIGAILSQNLAKNGLTSFEALRKANPRNLEIFCNRLPPFGLNVQQTCIGLPVYSLRVNFAPVVGSKEKVSLMVEVHLVNGQDLRTQHSLPKSHLCHLLVGNVRDDKVLLCHPVTDACLLNRPDLTICFGADIDRIDLPNNHDDIECHLLSSTCVGLNAHKTVQYVEPADELSF